MADEYWTHAAALALAAIRAEAQGQLPAALQGYLAAAELLVAGGRGDRDPRRARAVHQRASEYLTHAEQLRASARAASGPERALGSPVDGSAAQAPVALGESALPEADTSVSGEEAEAELELDPSEVEAAYAVLAHGREALHAATAELRRSLAGLKPEQQPHPHDSGDDAASVDWLDTLPHLKYTQDEDELVAQQYRDVLGSSYPS